MNVTLTFGNCVEQWLAESNLSDTTKTQRRSYYKRELLPDFRDRCLTDISEADVRELCNKIKMRGAPGTSVQVLSIVRATYTFARFKGYAGGNPARFISPGSIAKFSPRNRALTPDEINLLHRLVADPKINIQYQLAIRLLLLTLARRGELLLASWTEIDFDGGFWTVPPGRAKATKVRRVYLSTQAIDALIHLKALAGESQYIFPSPLDTFSPMAATRLDVCTKSIVRRARMLGISLGDFAPSDLRVTGEHNLKQAGFDTEWIEVLMAREEVMRRQRIYELDRYNDVLRHMMQEWANMIDAWAIGARYVPALVPSEKSPVICQDVT